MKIYQFGNCSNICGVNIKKYRKEMQISQKDLAARLQSRYNVQLEQKAISRIEVGERFITDYELKAISKILNVRIDVLYKGTDLE